MIVNRDVSIPADDGLLLKADIFRPDGDEPAPVIMVIGPYGKGVEYKTGYAEQWAWLLDHHPDLLQKENSSLSYMTWETVDPETWTAWGYVCIRVDSRGTGRTQGMIDIFSPREVKDFYDAIEWAGIQPWSNGKVGLNGISYYAINQWLVAALQPPHLAAMIPWEGAADIYRDYLRHGGILSNDFVQSWYVKQVVSNQHGNPNGYEDPWLQQRATGPSVLSVEELAALRTTPWDEALKRPLDSEYYRERSADWSRVTVPFLSASNWGGTGLHARGNYEGFTQSVNAKQKWLEVHAGRHDEGFYLDSAMSMQRRFLDHFLKGVDNGWDREPPVLLQTRRPNNPFGEFRKYESWPLPNTQWAKCYLSASDKTLSFEPVQKASKITFDAVDEEVLFQTDALTQEMEITGPMALKLAISSTTSDADFFVTVQAFSPDGKEVEFQGAWDPHTPLAQGWLRASQRKLDTDQTKPYRPYHSHDEIQPLTPGDIYDIDIEIWPTHIILPAGYWLTVRIGGRDFIRATDDEIVSQRNRGSGPFLHTHPLDRPSNIFAGKTTIYTGPEHRSSILLPVIPSSIINES